MQEWPLCIASYIMHAEVADIISLNLVNISSAIWITWPRFNVTRKGNVVRFGKYEIQPTHRVVRAKFRPVDVSCHIIWFQITYYVNIADYTKRNVILNPPRIIIMNFNPKFYILETPGIPHSFFSFFRLLKNVQLWAKINFIMKV